MPKFRRGACKHIQTIRSHLLGRFCIYLCKESVGGETLPGAVDLDLTNMVILSDSFSPWNKVLNLTTPPFKQERE